MVDFSQIKKQFPIFQKYPSLAYLDNAATTQKPQVVIDAITNYYKTTNANVHRGIYELSEKATADYEKSREVIAQFINANYSSEVIFTSGTTDSINKLALSLLQSFKPKDSIIISPIDHHSNLIPWQQWAKQFGIEIYYLKFDKNYEIDLEDLENIMQKHRPRLLSCTHISNVTGMKQDIKKIAKIAQKYNCVVHVDAAQSIAHTKVDVQAMGIDFLSFSGHKIYGPTGIGVLWGKSQALASINPLSYGGGMIKKVTLKGSSWDDLPHKHEAGTPNIEGAIGLKSAIEFVSNLSISQIEEYENSLTDYADERMSAIPKIERYAKYTKDTGSIIAFNLKGIHPHDVASIVAEQGVAIRAGHHCCQILHRDYFKVQATSRASFAVYNNKKDIDKLIIALEQAINTFY